MHSSQCTTPQRLIHSCARTARCYTRWLLAWNMEPVIRIKPKARSRSCFINATHECFSRHIGFYALPRLPPRFKRWRVNLVTSSQFRSTTISYLARQGTLHSTWLILELAYRPFKLKKNFLELSANQHGIYYRLHPLSFSPICH